MEKEYLVYTTMIENKGRLLDFSTRLMEPEDALLELKIKTLNSIKNNNTLTSISLNYSDEYKSNLLVQSLEEDIEDTVKKLYKPKRKMKQIEYEKPVYKYLTLDISFKDDIRTRSMLTKLEIV